MKNDFIVAVELGSSAIRGIAGKRLPNGSVEVVGAVEEPAQSCIHKRNQTRICRAEWTVVALSQKQDARGF